jgi:ATP-dependent helicase/nuclease subunit B
MNPDIILLGWNEPWVDLLARWLWTQPDRLRHRLVVVPTRESGRRLREVLLALSQRKGTGALLGPRIATPEDFFRLETTLPDAVRWAGWVHVLRPLSDDRVAALFPAGISQKDDGWRAGVARQIEQAREVLASRDAGFDTVAALLPEEGERWLQLAALEKSVVGIWRKWGYPDPARLKRDRARRPELPAGVREVIVAGVADPTWLAIEAWRRLADGGLPFTVLVAAPEELRSAFDEWGRPHADFWTDRQRHSSPLPTRMLVAADALGLAEVTVQACAEKSNSDMAIGACDAAFSPSISRRFVEAGWTTFDPQGIPVAPDGWPELLEALAETLEAPEDPTALARLARHPVIWGEWLPAQGARAAFAALERWEKQHGGADPARVIAQLLHPKNREDLRAAGRLLQQVRGFLEELLAGKTNALEQRLRAWLEADSPALAEVLSSETRGWRSLQKESFSLPLKLSWLAGSLSAQTLSPDPSSSHLALQGWLELLYDPAPHLVLAGLHEGSVPETPAPNPLITEAVREKLGLRDRKSRLAREVFLYTTMVESRRTAGSVTVVTAQTSPQGEPCRPSRVLLHARPGDLPRRVLAFIKDKPDVPVQSTPPWARGDWRVCRPSEAEPNRPWEHLSPSTLRAYLDCPTRFYFNKVLGWEKFEPFAQELDGAGFGDLLHQVFCRWAGDPEAREFTDSRKLQDCWTDLLHQQVAAQFGTTLPPLLQLQVMSAQERLQALAEHQVQQVREGWHIDSFEREFTDTLTLAGLPVKMRVDRIDRHEDGQRVRVIDYKTAKKAFLPQKAHLCTWPAELRPEPLGALLSFRGQPYGWSDLQLPLYVKTVQAAMNLKDPPQACYVLLPEAVSETGFKEFPGLDNLLGNAMEWAQNAAQRILDGVFWPPSPEAKYDLFAALAPEGLAQALGQEWAEFLSGQARRPGGAA